MELAGLYPQYTAIDRPAPADAPTAELLRIAPNPCPVDAVVIYRIARPEHVRLGVCDVSGRERIRLVDGARPHGRNSVLWDGMDRHGIRVAQGVYWLRLETATGNAVRKVMIVR